MKAILRKGMAACAAMLMGANVMAQGNVFIEKTDVNFSGYVNFIPSEILIEGTSKIILPIYESGDIYDEVRYFLGYQVMDENLEVEKEFRIGTVDEAKNTRLKITEQLNSEGNWVETSRSTRNKSRNECYYMSETSFGESYAVMSQTLFNNDDKYEIIVPVYGGEAIYQEENSSRRTVYKNYVATSLSIVSETGEVLQTLDAGENKFICLEEGDTYIVRIGNKTYIALPIGDLTADAWGEWYYRYDFCRWYEICKETSSINFVRETRAAMNISPTIADRDAQITITLNDDNNGVPRELVVTSVNGQLVDRREIPAGENTVKVSAAMMRSGMYNFTLQKRGQVVDNGKVIVK